ncbi:MAG: EAL domain-containing protein [Synechococcales cyanobacterium K44_A2020_017]|nr:EAL domain-containing protein [Synechococcales cyanobacterium K32_A2020_035]MBF2093267.1 EAL domain-containing protein [Synechococcales cyanobacterium K44_A2020_017]
MYKNEQGCEHNSTQAPFVVCGQLRSSPGSDGQAIAPVSTSWITSPLLGLEDYPELSEGQMLEASDTSAITALLGIPLAIAHPQDGRILYATPVLAEQLAMPLDELMGQPLSAIVEDVCHLEWVAQCQEQPNDQHEAIRRLRHQPDHGSCDDAEPEAGDRWLDLRYASVIFEGQPALGILVYDITPQTQVAQELRGRVAQQEAIARLGQQAIAEPDLAFLLSTAVAVVQETLGVDYVQILELLPNGHTLLLRSGVGWQDGMVGNATISTRPDTQAGYTLLHQKPVIVEDLQIETRFSGAPFLHNHQVMSGMTVVVPGKQDGFGVLGVHTRLYRRFTQDDANFLQAIANVLAAAIARQQVEDDLRLMKRAIAASSNGIVITDPTQLNNPVIYANPAFERITGYSVTEIIGRNCRILQGDDTAIEAKQHIRQALQSHQDCHVVLKNYRKDGTPFWNELFIAPVFDANGYLTNFVGIQNDITQHRQAQERLLNEYSLLNGILQTSVTAVIVFDHTGAIVFANDRAEELLGLGTTELMQQHYDSLTWRVCNEDGCSMPGEQPFQIIVQSGQPLYNVSVMMTRHDGSVRYLSMNGSPLRDSARAIAGVVFSIADMTEQRRMEAALRESEYRLNSILDSLDDVVWSYSPTMALLYVSQAVESVYQRPVAAFRETSSLRLEMVHPYDQGVAQSSLHTLLTTGQSDCIYRIMRPSGETRWIRDRAHAVYDAQGQVLRFDGMSSDITDRKRAEDDLRKSEERFRLTFERAPIGMAITTPAGQFLQVNQALCQALGYREVDLLKLTADAVTHPADIVADRLMLQRLLDGELSDVQLEKRYISQDGSLVYAILQVALIRDRHGAPLHVIHQVIDITARKRMEEQILHDALHDVLTGLPNRLLFLDRLQQAMARAERDPSRQFAVLFLDIDRFKVVNDSLGHRVGDQLLKAIAERLDQCLRPGDTIARLGGDEFALLLDNIHGATGAAHVAERIYQLLQLPFHLNGYDVFATVSIGITLNMQGYTEPEHLLRDADTAMYRAKENGRGHYLLFQTDMYDQAVAVLELESDLRRAIERQELRVYYQPIVSLVTGELSGFEALVRWQHPKRGLVSPVDFIPIAEETGLIIPIGMWVLQEACQQLQAWRSTLPQADRLIMSVNLSPRQLSSPTLVDDIQQVIEQVGLPPHRLKLEMTESGIMDNATHAAVLLERLTQRGIQLCIDDFGTGYSSLSRLHAFPIGMLKIDRSFVSEIMHDEGKAKIVQAIVALAHALGMGVIGEGIETPEQLAALRSLHCDSGQGYWFGKPVSANDTVELLKRGQVW